MRGATPNANSIEEMGSGIQVRLVMTEMKIIQMAVLLTVLQLSTDGCVVAAQQLLLMSAHSALVVIIMIIQLVLLLELQDAEMEL